MKLKPILLRVETYGMKNIKDKIKIDFYKDTIQKTFNMKNKNIKAIYGANGAGKTAIILSMKLYNDLCLTFNYLMDNKCIKYLNQVINQKVREFYISVTYSTIDKEKNNKVLGTYRHTLILTLEGDEINFLTFTAKPKISLERLELLNKQTINEPGKILYEVNNGILNINDNSLQSLNDLLYDKTSNILGTSTLMSFVFEHPSLNCENMSLAKLFHQLPLKTFGTALLHNINFNDHLIVYYDATERTCMRNHNVLYNHYSRKNTEDNFNYNIVSLEPGNDIITKNSKNMFEIEIKKLYSFIKIFKPDLKSIEIEYYDRGDCYECKKSFIYDDYKIDSQFESNGIQKLIRIFNVLKFLPYDFTVFIDELDTNINTIYLNKLIEYFIETGKGQLCFTAHNI